MVLFYLEKDHGMEFNLLCCYHFRFLIIDNQGVQNVADLANSIRYLAMYKICMYKIFQVHTCDYMPYITNPETLITCIYPFIPKENNLP